MNIPTGKPYIRITFILAVLAGLIWINGVVLTEAFGAGPPYYSRTTNMDKWSNPLPWLLSVDAFVLIVGGIRLRYRFRQRRTRP